MKSQAQIPTGGRRDTRCIRTQIQIALRGKYDEQSPQVPVDFLSDDKEPFKIGRRHHGVQRGGDGDGDAVQHRRRVSAQTSIRRSLDETVDKLEDGLLVESVTFLFEKRMEELNEEWRSDECRQRRLPHRKLARGNRHVHPEPVL